MIPYRDDNPRLGTPAITVGLIALNSLSWLLLQGVGSPAQVARSVCTLGLIPGALTGQIPPGTPLPLGPELTCVPGALPVWLTPLTSMFAHGGWFHLLGNMWFLWLFGDNVEDGLGHGRFLVFYLCSGLAAVLAQVLAAPGSAIPMVGASGAISGVMGAYVVLYPRARVHMWIFLGFLVLRAVWPAYLMLGYWLLLQLLGSIVGALTPAGGGVAFTAHVGGFLAGVGLVWLLRRKAPPAPAWG